MGVTHLLHVGDSEMEDYIGRKNDDKMRAFQAFLSTFCTSANRGEFREE